MAVTVLKIERIKQGIPQWKFASRIGIDGTKLSKIETGRIEPTDEVKKACSRILNLPIDVLFAREESVVKGSKKERGL